jgi:hypothetical protein
MKPVFSWLLESKVDFLTPGQRATHAYVIGQPGTGKSRALESWVMQDIASGQGVGVIDPHGDLFQNLLARLSSKPETWERVVILDPCDQKWTVSFNPLEAVGGFSQERLAAFLTDVVVKIWKLSTASTPRLIWLLSNSFLALSSLGLTLLDLPRFLLDKAFRESLLPRLANERARAFFLFEFPKTQGAIHQWTTPLLNKIGSLIFDPDLRLMLAGGSKLDFRTVLDRRLILLVNLPKGILGEGTSALLGAFIVAHLQKAALSRANTRRRTPYFLYLDEFQNYTTDNIKDILSESRKYALSLILAHQYLDQLSSDLRSAVLNTAGTLICFRVGYHDARQLVYDIFPSPDFLAVSERGFKFNRVGGLPFLAVDERQKSLRWEGLAQVLTKLPPRQFWSRRRGTYTPIKRRTLEMPDPIITPRIRSMRLKLLDISGQKFGKLKHDVQRELDKKRTHFVDDSVGGYPRSGSAPEPVVLADSDTPRFWGE